MDLIYISNAWSQKKVITTRINFFLILKLICGHNSIKTYKIPSAPDLSRHPFQFIQARAPNVPSVVTVHITASINMYTYNIHKYVYLHISMRRYVDIIIRNSHSEECRCDRQLWLFEGGIWILNWQAKIAVVRKWDFMIFKEAMRNPLSVYHYITVPVSLQII